MSGPKPMVLYGFVLLRSFSVLIFANDLPAESNSTAHKGVLFTPRVKVLTILDLLKEPG